MIQWTRRFSQKKQLDVPGMGLTRWPRSRCASSNPNSTTFSERMGVAPGNLKKMRRVRPTRWATAVEKDHRKRLHAFDLCVNKRFQHEVTGSPTEPCPIGAVFWMMIIILVVLNRYSCYHDHSIYMDNTYDLIYIWGLSKRSLTGAFIAKVLGYAIISLG